MFDNGTDRIYTEKVERHTHPSYTILAGLMLYMYAKCSYRQVVKVMEVMRQTFGPVLPWIFEDLPSHATIEDWVEKAGLAAMRSKVKELDSTYALIVDESVDIGGKKLFLGLAFNPECQGRPLGCNDMTVVEMGVAKSRNGDEVAGEIHECVRLDWMGRESPLRVPLAQQGRERPPGVRAPACQPCGRAASGEGLYGERHGNMQKRRPFGNNG